jgi:hypothetical protein
LEGIAVIGRPTFHDIRDKYISTFQIDAGEKFIEELTGGTNKRATLPIFVKAGSFSNKQDLRIWIAFARHGFGTTFTQITESAGRDLYSYLLEQFR